MRGANLLLLLALLTACGGADQSKPDSAAAAPQAVDADAFKTRLQPRLPDCTRRTQSTKGLSEADAQSFCSCQLEIIAAKTSPEERDSLLKMTFQSEGEKASPADAKLATDALLRLQPEISRACG